MKGFETGVSYLRKEAREAGLIGDSDNDDVLIENLVLLLKVADEVGMIVELHAYGEEVDESEDESEDAKTDGGSDGGSTSQVSEE